MIRWTSPIVDSVGARNEDAATPLTSKIAASIASQVVYSRMRPSPSRCMLMVLLLHSKLEQHATSGDKDDGEHAQQLDPAPPVGIQSAMNHQSGGLRCRQQDCYNQRQRQHRQECAVLPD